MVSIHSLPLALSYGKACYRMVQMGRSISSTPGAEADKPRSEWNGKGLRRVGLVSRDLLPDDGASAAAPSSSFATWPNGGASGMRLGRLHAR